MISLREKITQRFLRALSWNAFEAFFYQGVYLIHQTILFKVACCEVFGVAGIFFSVVYLAVTIGNIGLDKSMVQLFNHARQSKEFFYTAIITQYIIHYCILLIVALGASLLFQHNPLFALGCILFFIESLKKSLKTIAQLFLLNKKTAIIESCGIALYSALCWLHILYLQCSINSIITPLLITSGLEVLVLLYINYKEYKKIPSKKDSSFDAVHCLKLRLNTFLYQLSTLIFSSNALLAILSFYTGVATIALFHWVKSVLAFLVFFCEKVLTLPIGSVLIRSTSTDEQKSFFSFARSTTNLVATTACLILLLIHGIAYSAHKNTQITNKGFLFSYIILIGVYFIPYEQIAIINNRIWRITLLHGSCALIFYCVLMYGLSLEGSLLTLLALRISSLGILHRLQ